MISTEACAAVRIQGIFRLRLARREALRLAQESYEKVYDETVHAFYYFNTYTGQSQWTKPKCFHNDDAVHQLTIKKRDDADAHDHQVSTSAVVSVHS
jgi:hypothetical protein